MMIRQFSSRSIHGIFSNIFVNMFGISQDEMKATMFRIFMQYRVAFAILNLAPYIALKIME